MTPIEIMARGRVDTTSMHDKADDVWRAYEGSAKADLTALSEAGWSLVPSEATDEILLAIMNDAGSLPQSIYETMIEAGAYKV